MKMVKHVLVRGGAALTVATLAWHASNFAFNAVAAHLLGPAHYGTLAAVIALVYLTTPLLVSVQTVAARLTTERLASGREGEVRALVRHYALRLGVVAAVCAGIASLLSVPAARFLHIPSWKPLAILAVAVALSVFTHIQRGVFQGSGRFGRFAVSAVVEALIKVIGCVVIVAVVSRTEDGAVTAIAIAAAAAGLAGVALLRFLPPAGPLSRVEHPYRYSLGTLASLVLLSMLLSMDVVAGKHYLSPKLAGIYAAASLASKVAYFGTSMVSVLSFPFFSRRFDQQRDARGPLLAAFATIAAFGLALAAFYALWPQVVIRPLFGHAFVHAGKYVAPLAIAVTLYAIAYQGAMYLLARRQLNGVIGLLAAVILQLTLLYTFHGSPWQIVLVQLGVMGAAALAMCVFCLQFEVERSPAAIAHGA